ncbi:MAG: phage major capsid protein [Xanthobacteraceae bacterium]
MSSLAQRIGRTVAAAETKGAATAFLNFAIASALEPRSRKAAAELFHARWPRSIHKDAIERHVKSVVTPGSTTSSPLVELQPLASAFIEHLRPLTVLGRISDSMRRVPFNIKVPRVTAGATAHWIGQGRVKAASALALDNVSLPHAKIVALVVISKDLARLSDPSAEAVIRNDMTQAIAAAADTSFLTPSLAAVANQSPASITNGATEITSTGTTADAATADLRSLFAAVSTPLTAPYLIMRPSTALWLASLGNTFPNIGATGGSLWGVPVIVSANAPTDGSSPAKFLVTLLDAAEVLLAEGDIEIKTATDASIQMESSPDSPVTASTVLLDFFSHDLLGLMAERFIYWQPRRSGAVVYLYAPY